MTEIGYSTEAHTFTKSLPVGKAYEQALYDILRNEFRCSVEPVDMALQRLGIDAILTTPTGYRYSLEVKSDSKASDTGNAFIETHSSEDKLGWAYTSCAQLLFYFLPRDAEILCVPMYFIKPLVLMWEMSYPVGYAQNKGYRSTGILLPLDVLRSMSYKNLYAVLE